jgi:hypothetical protein
MRGSWDPLTQRKIEMRAGEEKKMKSKLICLAILTLFATVSIASASTKCYVDGKHGNDSNDCKSRQHACKTISHAITLTSGGDSIFVAPATYQENLTIPFTLKTVGSGSQTIVIDGGEVASVVMSPTAKSEVMLSDVTVRNGRAQFGGGIQNGGTMTIINSIISGNTVVDGFGGGIQSGGTSTIKHSTISENNPGPQWDQLSKMTEISNRLWSVGYFATSNAGRTLVESFCQ